MIDMDKMKIGDKFSAPIYPEIRGMKVREGIVVYVHPKKRFFTVEFDTAAGGSIRESYHPAGPLACTEQKENPHAERSRRVA